MERLHLVGLELQRLEYVYVAMCPIAKELKKKIQQTVFNASYP